MRVKYIRLTILLILLISITAFGKVRLPKLVSDGMVLQRDVEVNIWGWAAIYENISISLIDSVYKTVANDSGKWEVRLPSMKAGGPYIMNIYAGDTVTIKDILIGDVWICSGQSNMELSMERVSPIYENEIANSDNSYIRCFTVPQKYIFNEPQKDFESGSWKKANPKNVLDFSAAAYFFAKGLYDKYKIPIGIINTSLGGSPAESWISEEALKAFPAYYREAQRFKDSTLITRIDSQDNVRIHTWY